MADLWSCSARSRVLKASFFGKCVYKKRHATVQQSRIPERMTLTAVTFCSKRGWSLRLKEPRRCSPGLSLGGKRKKESFGITKAAWFCMETTVAGCLVLKEATSEGGHGRDSRPGNVCDLGHTHSPPHSPCFPAQCLAIHI